MSDNLNQQKNDKNNKLMDFISIICLIVFGAIFINNIYQNQLTRNLENTSDNPIDTTNLNPPTSILETTTTTEQKNISHNTTPITSPVTSTLTIPATTLSISQPTNTTLQASLSFQPSISSKYEHSCVLLERDKIKCWGPNDYGQLGNGQKSDYPSHSAVSVSNLRDAARISVGGMGTCVLLTDSSVNCWGVIYPKGEKVYSYQSPYNVYSLQNVIAVASGYLHTCVLFRDRTVRCWGNNEDGQLGDGTNEDKIEPVEVRDLFEVKEIAAGYFHTCALLMDGTVKCWGNNEFGELGNGTKVSSNIPIVVPNLSDVKSISAGLGYTCALLNNNNVKCWGRNYGGQLGDGTTNDRTTPVSVKGLEGDEIEKIVTGGFRTCVLLKNKTIKCWGEGYTKNGVTVDYTTHAELIPNLENIIDVAVGRQHTCVLLNDKTVKCWGLNNIGQTGDGTFNYYNPLPIKVIGLE